MCVKSGWRTKGAPRLEGKVEYRDWRTKFVKKAIVEKYYIRATAQEEILMRPRRAISLGVDQNIICTYR